MGKKKETSELKFRYKPTSIADAGFIEMKLERLEAAMILAKRPEAKFQANMGDQAKKMAILDFTK